MKGHIFLFAMVLNSTLSLAIDVETNTSNETSVKKVDKKMLQAKRKGRGYSILNTAMGLDDSIKTKKKTLLG